MNYPNRQEFVICKVERIMPYGVNVSLEEYDVKGFVPLSQVASRWVKNIRNFVKMGQIRVGKVLYINQQKQQVDISFAAVSDMQENQKLNEWRQSKRVNQLLGILAKDVEKDVDDIWEEIITPILENYNSAYEAFKDMIIYGKDYVKEVPEVYREKLHKILKDNIVIHEKEINEEINLASNNVDGLEMIKKIFKNVPKDKEVELNTTYIGNGKYLIKTKAMDYKKIEKYLTTVNDYLQKEGKKFDTFGIKRKKN